MQLSQYMTFQSHADGLPLYGVSQYFSWSWEENTRVISKKGLRYGFDLIIINGNREMTICNNWDTTDFKRAILKDHQFNQSV